MKSLVAVLVLAGAPVGSAPSLQQAADQLVQQVSEALPRQGIDEATLALSVVGDLSIAGKEARITQELLHLLEVRLESIPAVARVLSLPGTDPATTERARREGATLLLRCQLGVEQGAIHLAADLTPVRLPFWDRLVDPVPKGVLQHLFVSVPADQEIDVLLGKPRLPPVLGSWHLTELLQVPGRVLDVGLGDIDGDGRAELLLLSETSIEVFRLQGGQAQQLGSRSLVELPEEKIRVRDPSGSLVVVDFNLDGRAEVFYKLFDRRTGEILTWNGSALQPIRKLEKVPLCVFRKQNRPTLVYGTPDSGTNRYLAFLEVADINESSGRRLTLPAAFAAMRCWQGKPDQEPWLLLADLHGGLLRLDPDGKAQPLAGEAGSGFGVVDLDLDGVPEVVVSDPVWPGEQDSIRVLSNGSMIWRSRDVAGGIIAVAGGDIGGQGKFEAVLLSQEAGGAVSRIYLLGR